MTSLGLMPEMVLVVIGFKMAESWSAEAGHLNVELKYYHNVAGNSSFDTEFWEIKWCVPEGLSSNIATRL